MNQVFPKLVWETIIWYMPAKTKAIHYNDNTPGNIIRQIIIEQSKMPPESLRFWANVVSRSDVPFSAAENDPFMIKLFKDYIWFLVDENEVIIKGQKSRNKVYFTDLVNVYYICHKKVRNYFEHKDAAPSCIRYKNKNPAAFYHHRSKLNNKEFCEIALLKHDHPFHDQISIEATSIRSYRATTNPTIYSHQYMINSPKFLRCYVLYNDLDRHSNLAFKVSDMTFSGGVLDEGDFYKNSLFTYKASQYSSIIKPWQKIILDPQQQLAFLFDVGENEDDYSTLFQQKFNDMKIIFEQNHTREKTRLTEQVERYEKYHEREKEGYMLSQSTLDSIIKDTRLEAWRHHKETLQLSNLLERARLGWEPDNSEYAVYQSVRSGIKQKLPTSDQMNRILAPNFHTNKAEINQWIFEPQIRNLYNNYFS